jgi:demethylmenaquinone methyltransferase/2-methoxy-6-polyprenyl-1,4-benzoquinol methylase
MSDNPAPLPTTDFGFRRVPMAEKKELVRAIFDSVARRYDLMNDLMSLGIHRVWKRIFVTALDPRPSYRLLDLAAGTGDIVLNWAARGGGPALAADVNESMLSIARDRAIVRGFIGTLDFLVADAERPPLRSGIFDRVSIAFGLRNCTDKQAVLAEARRVLRPGGRFFCLEFSRLQVAAFAPVYDAWSFQIIPRLGQLIIGGSESYRYLVESIRTFPDQAHLVAMMETAGFAKVSVCNLSGGIAAIHSGWRL